MNFEEWKEKRLGEVAKITKLSGFEFTKCFNYVDDGDIIAIRALNVKNGTLDLTDVKRITSSTSCGLTRSKLYKNDIVLTYTGAKFGEVAIIKYNNKFHLAPNVAKATPLENICYPYYLYCFMRSDNFHTQLINYSVGSSQPTIPMNIIRQLSVLLPPLSEQKTIAATLSCLDDKIELNNRMNRTLEEMAQAIFKSWFVDFEPFQGGEFVDSELGSIPKGWRVGRLTEIADYLNGLAMQKYPPESAAEALPVLKIKELHQGRTDSESDLCAPDIEEKYIIHDGDVVFSWSGSLLVDLWCGGTCGLNQHLFKVTSSKYQKWFYYMWTLYHLREFQAVAKDKATTMGHIKRENLTKSKVLIPSSQVLEDMNSAMSPIIEKIIANRLQSRKLEEIRDSLLPKLMNGEIRVPIEVK